MSTHSLLQGLQLHEPYHFVQETDPGAVGSAKYWLKVSTGIVKRRNADNNGWDAIGGASLVDPTTTKGDLIARGASAIDRLPVGTDGQILVADSGESLGLVWADAAGATPDWVSESPNTPPGSPNAMDDEFQGSTLNVKWTWNNQGGATAVVGNGVLLMNAPTSTTNSLRSITQALPAAPWEFTARIGRTGPFVNHLFSGLMLRESGTDKRVSIHTGTDTNDRINSYSWSDATTVALALAHIVMSQTEVFLRIARAGTTLTYSYSFNGFKYATLYTELITASFTSAPNQIGIVTNADGADASTVAQWFRRTL